MPLIRSISRKGLAAACFVLAVSFSPPLVLAQEEPGASLLRPDESGEDMVERIVFRDETTDQVLDLLERLTGRSIIRPQALPAATFTFNSQRPMTREEAILALESMLSINGIGVTPLGDLFLKVVPLARVRSEGPEFLSESTLGLMPSGRIVSRMIYLDFLGIDEVQTQLNLMITSGSGSIIPFPKANALLITDTVANLQAIEGLLAEVDRPFSPQTETRFFEVQYARAEDMVAQLETLAGVQGVPELSARTKLMADPRSNQIIIVADRRQMDHFSELIQKLDVQAELTTQNEVIFLKHANAVEVASILSQLATGRSGGGGTEAGLGSRAGGAGSGLSGGGSGGFRGGSRGSGTMQGRGGGSTQRGGSRPGTGRSGGSPQVPQIPGAGGVRAQQANESAAPAPVTSVDGAQAALDEITGSVAASDFSETLTILPDERSNAIVVSGTKQDISLITDLIEKIDIVLSQVRIEVFIAEVTLDNNRARGITEFGLQLSDSGDLTGSVEGPGFVLGRAAESLNWSALFTAAETNANINVLSVPTIVTTHNKEATIEVGEERPIITGTLTDSQFTSSIRSQIQYQNIGITLVVLPLIGSDGTIQLEIEQHVDDIISEVEIDGNNQPVIGTRRATSFVSVANRETVVLGGLQSTNVSDTRSRLGILGQIPVLGNLFTSRSQVEVRRELLVFIRPTVLHNTDEAHQDAQKQIDRFSRAPYVRHHLDPDEYPHPDAPAHSDEARALREESLRRQAEREAAGYDDAEQPVHVPVLELEVEPDPELLPENEPEINIEDNSTDAEPSGRNRLTRRGPGAGSRL